MSTFHNVFTFSLFIFRSFHGKGQPLACQPPGLSVRDGQTNEVYKYVYCANRRIYVKGLRELWYPRKCWESVLDCYRFYSSIKYRLVAV